LQYGTPHEIYFEPKDRFTAEFIGRANFIENTMVRPEWIRLEKDCANVTANAEFYGTVESSEFLGAFTRYKVFLDGKILAVDQPTVLSEKIKKGDKVGIFFQRKLEM